MTKSPFTERRAVRRNHPAAGVATLRARRITTLLLLSASLLITGCGNPSIDLRGDIKNDANAKALATTTVGMPVEIDDVILPGGELEAITSKGSEDTDVPGVLRIVQAIPHGDDFRYSFVFYGLDPGDYNIADYLRPVDGESDRDLPKIPVSVTTLLPQGQVEPNRLGEGELPKLGGYRDVLWIGGILWGTVLMLLIFVNRKKKIVRTEDAERQATFADHLRPILQSASRGELSVEQQSRLERLLLSYWKERLGVSDQSPARAMAALKSDAQAGELVRQLEDWLHRPDPPENVDVEALLAPYRSVANLEQVRQAEEIVQAEVIGDDQAKDTHAASSAEAS